jgi:hypothetical protein
MSGLPEPETMWSVCSLLAEYCSTMDGGRFDEWAELFIPAGRLEMAPRAVVGREQLLRFGAKSPRGIHISGLPVISVEADFLSSRSPWTFVDLGNGQQLVGYYHDEIVWSDGRHRFSSRRVEMHLPPARR